MVRFDVCSNNFVWWSNTVICFLLQCSLHYTILSSWIFFSRKLFQNLSIIFFKISSEIRSIESRTIVYIGPIRPGSSIRCCPQFITRFHPRDSTCSIGILIKRDPHSLQPVDDRGWILNQCSDDATGLLIRAAKAVALLELIQDMEPTDAKLVAQCLYLCSFSSSLPYSPPCYKGFRLCHDPHHALGFFRRVCL